MVWFLLMETETVPMGWAPYEPMMPAAQGLDTRSWLGGRCCCRFPMRRNVSAELADSQYLHNQANGGKNAHHHDSEA